MLKNPFSIYKSASSLQPYMYFKYLSKNTNKRKTGLTQKTRHLKRMYLLSDHDIIFIIAVVGISKFSCRKQKKIQFITAKTAKKIIIKKERNDIISNFEGKSYIILLHLLIFPPSWHKINAGYALAVKLAEAEANQLFILHAFNTISYNRRVIFKTHFLKQHHDLNRESEKRTNASSKVYLTLLSYCLIYVLLVLSYPEHLI